MDTTTINNRSTAATSPGIDLVHTSRLGKADQQRILGEAEEFLGRIRRQSNQAYIRLDVEEQKAKTQGIPAYRWRALLITDIGRYYADDWEVGAVESVKKVLEQLETQMESRTGRINSLKQALNE